MSVYIDLVFLINFIFDAEILYILMKFFSEKICLWRIFAASLMGGMQGVFFFIPYFRILSASPIGILLPVVYVAIVLMPCSVKKCAIGYLIFLIISFVFSGAMNLFGFNAVSGPLLIFPVCMAIYILKKQICIKKKEVKMFYGGKCIKCDGLYDSGNSTYYMGTPVIFGNKNIAAKLIGADFDENTIWQMTDAKNVCLIPYKTVDKGGLALGLRLERAIIGRKEYKNVILGIFENKLESEIILNGIMV